ncbi:hypothetical protein FWC31_02465 [Candidatus Saccharibacteria bacterium]|nr:hypothetical protein [Candidatus Saccharibacteria bacterium]
MTIENISCKNCEQPCSNKDTGIDVRVRELLASKTISEFTDMLAEWHYNTSTFGETLEWQNLFEFLEPGAIPDSMLSTIPNGRLDSLHTKRHIIDTSMCLRRYIGQLDTGVTDIPLFDDKISILSLFHDSNTNLSRTAEDKYGKNAKRVIAWYDCFAQKHESIRNRHQNWLEEPFDVNARLSQIKFLDTLDNIYKNNPPPIFAENSVGYSFSAVQPDHHGYVDLTASFKKVYDHPLRDGRGNIRLDDKGNTLSKYSRIPTFNRNNNAVLAEGPASVLLEYRGYPAAIASFALSGDELTIYQLQGIKFVHTDELQHIMSKAFEEGDMDWVGKIKKHSSFGLDGMDWKGYCIAAVEQIAQRVLEEGVNIRGIKVIGAKNCDWCYQHEYLPLERVKKVYDETAERLGYELGTDGNWHKPLP